MSDNTNTAVNRLLNDDGEIVVPVAAGCTLRSASDTFLSGEYVRLCDGEGNELLYWDHTEWQEDPVLVMGAILNAAAGLRIDGNPTTT